MKVFLALLVLLPLAASRAPIVNPDTKTAIQDEYIVVFHNNATFTGRSKHMGMVRAALLNTTVANGVPKIKFEYNMDTFKGYAMRAGENVLDLVLDCDEVNYVERNQEVHALQSCQTQTQATWGIVRTNERDLNLDGNYFHKPNIGQGVNAYIVDTGIYLQNVEFGGRAEWGTDTVDTPSPETDENGHGTHVAGTVIGTRFGLAKGGTAIAVKVLNRSGSGTYDQVIAGVAWTAEHHKGSGRPSVANMSLGGGRSTAMNAAVAAAVRDGVVYVVAAGNENQNACNVSPASEESAITVGSTTNTDQRSSFSNYGTCVNVFAPGSSIESAWIGGPNAVNTISGTSMASPHIAGIAVKILSEQGSLTPAQVREAIVNLATPNKVVNPGTGSPNLLGFHECR